MNTSEVTVIIKCALFGCPIRWSFLSASIGDVKKDYLNFLDSNDHIKVCTVCESDYCKTHYNEGFKQCDNCFSEKNTPCMK